MKLGMVLVVVSVCALGCSKEAPSSGGPGAASDRPALGKERGDCKTGKVCDPGLLCLSNLCVRPPPADCQVVADQLASMDLGNYAEAEERAPVVANYKEACEKAYVSKEQGECIDKATTKFSAMECAAQMFPETRSTGRGDCPMVIAKIRASMQQTYANVNDPQTQQMMAKAMTATQQSCEQDGWPDALKKCVLATANGVDGMGACNQQMPPALQQKMAERMTAMMQQP
jgi:hypothetical protein